jgi:L-fucose isomerase-like protein
MSRRTIVGLFVLANVMIVMANNFALSTDWPESKDIHSITKAKCITQSNWCTGYDICTADSSLPCSGQTYTSIKRDNQREWGVCEGTLAIWSCTDYADFYCAHLTFYSDSNCTQPQCGA